MGSLVTAIALVLTFAPTGVSQAAVATAGSLSVTPAYAIAGETTVFTGKLPPKKSRPIALQRKSGSSWVTVAVGKSKANGTFSFRRQVPGATTTYRVLAKRVRLTGRTYRAVATPTKRVTVQPQSGTLSLQAASEVGQPVTATATFTPVRPGRPVGVQVKTGASWTQVSTGVESRTGQLSFIVPTDKTGSFTYRVIAQPFRGAAKFTTGERTIQISSPAPVDTTPPPVPTGVIATAGDASTHLAWNPVAAADLDGYLILRATNVAGPWTKLTPEPIATHEYDVAGLTNGTTYYFNVTSVDTTGNESNASTPAAATPAAAPAPVVNHCGALQADEVWDDNFTHRIFCDIEVPVGVELTVASGAVLKFVSDSGLQVDGTLLVNGTAAEPVVITSIHDDTAGGDTNGDGDATTPEIDNAWTGIALGSGETAVLDIDHAKIRNTHNDPVSDVFVGPAARFSLTNSSIAATQDITVGATGSVTVSNNEFTVNEFLPEYGGTGVLRVYRSGGTGDMVVEQNDLRSLSLSVTQPREDAAAPIVSGNTVTGSRLAAAIFVAATHLRPSQMTGNTGSNNTVNVFALAGSLDEDVTLPTVGLPFAIFNAGEAMSGLSVPWGRTLHINAGAVIKVVDVVCHGCPSSTDSGLAVEGTLLVDGTAAEPVVFTSIYDDTAGGDTNGDGDATTPQTSNPWRGIYASGTTSFPGTIDMDGVDIRFAQTALSVDGAVDARIRGRVADSSVGVASASTYVDAIDVDWGSSAGPAPFGTGASATGMGVHFIPWTGYVPPPRPPVALPQPVPEDNPTSCADVTVFGLRGSGEEPLEDWPAQAPESYGFAEYTTGMLGALFSGVRDERPSTTFKSIGIAYQALPVPIVNANVSLPMFLDSIFDGVDKFKQRLRQEATDCPDTKFVVLGYSQGALAAHRVVTDLELVGDTAILDRIVGLGFVADPGRVPNGLETTWDTANTPAAGAIKNVAGVYASITAPAFRALPNALVDRTISICHRGDAVCAPRAYSILDTALGQLPGIPGNGPHNNYTSEEATSLGAWLAPKVLAALP